MTLNSYEKVTKLRNRNEKNRVERRGRREGRRKKECMCIWRTNSAQHLQTVQKETALKSTTEP